MADIRPAVSVVVASCRSRSVLTPALAALIPQLSAAHAELIVARRPTEVDEGWILGEFPQCRVIVCPPEHDIPRLRGTGMAAARGAWVAVTEDNCVADPAWLERLAAAMDATHAVVGGGMHNARTERAIDWAAFFAEYGFFGEGTATDTGPLITGANVGYPGSVLRQVTAWAREGWWEDVIHGRLNQAGVRLIRAEDAVVAQQLRYQFADFVRDRFEHGRDYARVRGASLGTSRRMALALTTPLLPPLLASRIFRATGHRTPLYFARALPYTLAFLSAWSVGEAVGYCTGSRAA